MIRFLAATAMVAAASAFSGTVLAQTQPAGGTAGGDVVLDTAGVWRMHHTLKPPVLQQPDGEMKPLMLNVKWLDCDTAPPSSDWTRPDMNDRAWMRGPARRSARTPYLARLSMRGKFEVTDPSAVRDLSLALEYHGGAVVYLNGTEFGRGNLPSGKDAGQALADAYPMEAFLDGQGELLREARQGPSAALRTRRLNLAVPKALLRKGINVLAIDIVRAPYPSVLEDKKPAGVKPPAPQPAASPGGIKSPISLCPAGCPRRASHRVTKYP